MKESKKPHVNIGTIGHVDHSKNTLTEAIKIVLKNKENICEEEQEERFCSKDAIIVLNSGGFDMTKGIKNYIGSTILGYRFVLDKESSKKIKGNKTSVNKQKRNSMYKIKTFRNRTFSRNK